ncbi:YkvA family protein [Methanobacterium sp.]|uniref:YkvA family protein n=1 Tax=Methanobacterium sp. TaxID=2164 RepID=UPI0031594976
MDGQFKDYYDILRENLDSYRGKYDRFIDYGPEMYKLLTDILNEENIEPDARLKICAAIAYFVAPFDVIPEQIYGPQGYVDDIYLCGYVINDLANSLGWDILEDAWQGDEELKEVLNESYSKSKEILGEKTEEILIYVGLK